jgi:hypothetical protein
LSALKLSSRNKICSTGFLIRSAEGQLLGSVAFESRGTDEEGIPVWTVAGEQFDFSGCFRTASLLLPPAAVGSLPPAKTFIKSREILRG